MIREEPRLSEWSFLSPASGRLHSTDTRSSRTKETLWVILRNPIYKGTVVYGKACYSEIGKRRGKTCRPESDWIAVEDATPVIIPVELWNAAQAEQGTRKFRIERPWHRWALKKGKDPSTEDLE